MKKFILFFACCFIIDSLSAQEMSKGNCAIYSYSTIVTADYYKNLDNLDIYSARENIKLEGIKYRVEKKLLDATFEELKRVFQEKYSIKLNKDYLEGKVYYNKKGYPFVFLKKAVKKGDADYYISFTVNYSNSADLKSAMLKTKQIKPEVSITMTIGDADGNKIHNKIKGVAKVDKPIKAKQISGHSRVDFTADKSVDSLTKPLLELMEKAVYNLTENFNPK